MKTLLALLAFAPMLAAAQSPAIWRCGNSYSAVPCAQGREVEAPAARPDADLQAARDAAAREQRLAERLRNERLRSEAAVRPGSGLIALGPVKPVVVRPAPLVVAYPRHHRRHPAGGGTSRAAAPASRPTKG